VSVGIAVVVLAGCQSANRKASYADNPLLMSRQPLIKKPLQNKNSGEVAQADSPKSLAPPVPIPPTPPASLVQAPPPAPSWDMPAGPALAADQQPTAPPPAALQPLPSRSI